LYYYIVIANLSMFYLPARTAVQRPFPDSPAKLRRFFFPAKFSGEKIFRTLNLPATPPVIARRGICAPAWPAAGHPPASVSFPKAGAKLQLSSLPTKFSENFFRGKFHNLTAIMSAYYY